MPSRAPRRSFASPFVVIAGASAACYVQPAHGPPPPPPTSGGPVATGPAPTDPTTPPPTDPATPTPPPDIVTNPPPPQPSHAARWRVYASAKGDCFAAFDVKCPVGEPGRPMPTCNPPPPMAYICPENVTLPVWVQRTEGSTVCQTVPEAAKCPPRTVCNPPPPQIVACPER